MKKATTPLTHFAGQLTNKYLTTTTRIALRPPTCTSRACMSMVSGPHYSPEGTKRRRLSIKSERTLSAKHNMVPGLIQEVDETADVSAPLQLTSVESTLRRLLLDVVAYIEENPAILNQFESQVAASDELRRQKLVLRFTGGWVRDKLLGRPSDDIDVAINKMTGEQFGLLLKEYIEIPGNASKYGLEGVATTDKQDQGAGSTSKSKIVGGLHKIEANPERSKHLETITTRILGLDIDLVNLRKETYTADSRNPQIEFGTPEEDALRRDATANAIFYNIHSQEVEDFTGRGRTDLQNKLLRTPLEPYQTFKDDPLRVLRLIRFASRLGWTIEPQTLEAMGHPDIKDALRRKISRERVGIELEKALRGPDPKEALRLIFDLDLYDTIFCDPHADAQAHEQSDLENWSVVSDSLQSLIDASDVVSDVTLRDSEEQFLAWQLAALVPYRHAPQVPAAPGKKPMIPLATVVSREGIKSTNKVCDVVTSAVRHASEISDSVVNLVLHRKGRLQPGQESAVARDTLGMKIRAWGPSWRSQLVYALLADIADHPKDADAYILRYTDFLRHLQDLDLLDAVSLRPILDGKALAQALQTKPGPWMKDALEVVMAWQLRNPGKTDTAEAIEQVKQHGELATSLAEHFLKLTIRPSFSKIKQSTITDQARRDTSGRPMQDASVSHDERETKPWKHPSEEHVINLLAWSVTALDESVVERFWPLLIPPLLTLIDDWETGYKKRGVFLLGKLLENTPLDLLQRTGLGPVFEDALLPCLTYLPPVASEKDCIALLPVVYDTLLLLARRRTLAPGMQAFDSLRTAQPPERARMLDTIMRKGVLYEYSHVSERPAIVQMLIDKLCTLMTELGTETVKHLKYILPMLNETLGHRLGKHHIGCLRQAAKCVTVVLETCRPRVTPNRGEILRGLTLCWIGLEGEASQDVDELRAELQACVEQLRYTIEKEGGDWAADRDTLIAADSRLEKLLMPS